MRGELDNRVRGRVTGKIWFVGCAEPVVLDLAGDCWRDLAGRRLEFVNPQPKAGDMEGLASLQRGTVGDITASRKVRVPDVPPEQWHLYYKTGREMPWHWGNALYLEWFSERNGRVVIETVVFDLKVVGEPTWEMSEAEEAAQRADNGEAMTGFSARLAEAIDPTDGDEDDPLAEWDEKPQTEEEAEAQQARSDMLADRIQARLRKEGVGAYERILREEIDRLQREEGRPEPTAEQRARQAEWIEEMNQAAEEMLANPDPEWIREQEREHPLVRRVMEFSLQLRATAEEEKWRPEDAGEEHPVNELLDATMLAAPKLAGALNGQAWPPELACCAHTIVRLKRAREFLEDAQRALESCHEEKLLRAEHVGPILVELVDYLQETDTLIAELRAKLERGTD